ncbi:tRNA pseudouridine(55) synthase TruB [Erysipelothrix sp. HDW6C]|uniref:tRNA pseudouridine(55) synthase TruB n=1 Tax=Erysipelothrix sp. HDW6C TaxID=2714930 RepID=UPI0014097427|nr:tRNA pseudouridine(55) synthase TruB [Erysipelothrix sp. HDW6C]QIK70063.1 tRNA pseudouridine(55) synthase TruB [Erysipelothrix sp. HDW6C]
MNGILCINKPESMTSFDVVAKVRRLTKAKVGHSGTLDPMATGVLVLALNQGTKALPYLGVEDKTYHAKLKLGVHTSTGDIWGDIERESKVIPYDETTLRAVLKQLTGPQEQRVPKVSAKKIDGKRSYDYVFNNEEVKQLYTNITIHNLELLSFTETEIEFTASVSNGTYIRTLCEDIAEGLGMDGTMSSLQRTKVGNFTLEQCIELDAISMDMTLVPTKEAIMLPRIENEKMEDYVKNGKRLKLNTPHDRLLIDAGDYYAVYERESDTVFKSVRGLW